MLGRSEPTGRSGDHASARLDGYLGDNIRQARARRGISLGDLGHVLGIHESTLAGYESGLEKVGATLLYRIAATLDVTLASLFGVPQR